MKSIPQEIDREQIAHMPLIRFHGATSVIKDASTAGKVVKMLLKESVLGFDTESRPAFKKGESYPPALLQLATEQQAFLFQIEPIGSLEPLLDILENSNILKAGVAIRDDIKRLQGISSFQPEGFVEISDLTTAMGITNTGLRSLVALFMKQRISKAARVTNWANPQLTKKQIQYAAIDAWASRQLYVEVLKHK